MFLLIQGKGVELLFHLSNLVFFILFIRGKVVLELNQVYLVPASLRAVVGKVPVLPTVKTS